MPMSNIKLRRLGQGDGAVFRQIRLEALKNAAESFGSTYEEEVTRSDGDFEDRVTRKCFFAAFEEDRVVGIVGFYQQEGAKFSHNGVVYGMYVTPEARSKGVGKALMEAVLAYAKNVVDVVKLLVVTENTHAIALYKNLGFREFGVEPKALKIGSAYVSETHMLIDFT